MIISLNSITWSVFVTYAWYVYCEVELNSLTLAWNVHFKWCSAFFHQSNLLTKYFLIGFYVITVVDTRIMVFWDILLSSLLDTSIAEGPASCITAQMLSRFLQKIFYQNTWHYMPDDESRYSVFNFDWW